MEPSILFVCSTAFFDPFLPLPSPFPEPRASTHTHTSKQWTDTGEAACGAIAVLMERDAPCYELDFGTTLEKILKNPDEHGHPTLNMLENMSNNASHIPSWRRPISKATSSTNFTKAGAGRAGGRVLCTVFSRREKSVFRTSAVRNGSRIFVDGPSKTRFLQQVSCSNNMLSAPTLPVAELQCTGRASVPFFLIFSVRFFLFCFLIFFPCF